MSTKCASCGTVDADARCSVCGTAYCDERCQQRDWPRHARVHGGEKTVVLPVSAAVELVRRLRARTTDDGELCVREFDPDDGVNGAPRTVDAYVPLDEFDLHVEAPSANGSFGEASFVEYTRPAAGGQVERTLFVVKSEPISRHADKALVEQSILKRLSDLYHAQRAQTADSVARDVVAALHGTKIDADTRQREIDVAVATEVASFDVAWPFPLYYDAWTCGGRSHVLMEYVEGRTLQRFADELRAADTAAFYYSQTRQHETTRATALEPLRVVMRRVHDACAELDRRGVVHQDLHDGNVMVSTRGARAGAITVIDFGQAVQRDDVVAGTNFEHFMWQLVARGHLPEEVAYAWLAEYDDTEYLRRLRLNVLRFHDTVLFDEYYTYGMMNYALFAFDHRRETLGALFDDATSSLYLRVPRLRSRALVTDGDAFDRFWRTLSSRLAAVSTSVPNRAMNKWRYIPVRERTQPPPATTVVPAKRPLQTATTATTTTTVSEPP